MPRTGPRQDFDQFDGWETFDIEDEIYANAEKDLVDDWEDDGAFAEVREPAVEQKAIKPKKPKKAIAKTSASSNSESSGGSREYSTKSQNDEVLSHGGNELEIDSTSAEVFSLLERSKSKNAKELLDLGGPSEDELNRIEEVGIDDYIDIVLSEDAQESEVEEKTETNKFEELEEMVMEEQKEVLDEVGLDHDEEIVDLVVQPLFEGIALALPTLFDEDGEVEYKTTARLAKRLVGENVKAIFVGTAEGEGNKLSRKERKTLVKAVTKSSEAMVCVDVSSPSTRQSIQIANDSIDAGATSLLITIDDKVRDPYLLCEALYENNREIPLIVKLVGEPLSIPISPEFLYDLPIAGVIDATGDISFFLHLMSAYSGPVYIGKSEMVLIGQTMGAAGVVLSEVAINTELVSKAFSGDAGAQAEIAMWKRETGDTQVRAIKIALEADFLVSSNMRD